MSDPFIAATCGTQVEYTGYDNEMIPFFFFFFIRNVLVQKNRDRVFKLFFCYTLFFKKKNVSEKRARRDADLTPVQQQILPRANHCVRACIVVLY